MRKLLTVLILAAAVALAAFNCDVGDKRVSLRFKFTPGMKLTYRQIAKGSVQVRDNDSLVRDRYNEITWTLEWQVRRVMEDQTAEVVERRRYHMKSLDRNDSTVIDTAKEGRELVTYVKPDGKIIDMEFSAGEEDASLAYLKDYYEQGMPVFPEGELRQGQSWTQTTKVILPEGPMEASTTFEIKSFGRQRGYDCVVIGYDGNLIIPLEPEESKEGWLKGGVDNITATGHMYFAYKEGLVVEQTERWVLDGSRIRVVENGDTVHSAVAVEYDVDHWLIKAE